MKNLNLIFKSLLLPFVLIILSSITYADNNSINGTCPGEIIGEIDGTLVSASHTENGAIGSGGNDRYRMTFPVSGTLDISAVNTLASRNADYRFYISRNNCGNADADWNIENTYNGTSPSFTVNVNAGDTIYIRLQSDGSLPNNGRHNYALSLDFVASSGPTTCPGTVIPNLEGTSVTATDSFTNITVPANTTYYYHFTPTVAGTIQTNSSANRTSNTLYILNGCGATLWSNTSNTNNKSSPEINVAANQQIVIAFERRYTTSLDLDIDFTFTKANNPPTFTSSGSTSINDTSNYLYTPTTNDIDGDTVTISATTLPSWLTFNGTTLSGIPGVANAGNHLVVLSASDGNGGIATQTYTINVVLTSNVPPVFTSTPLTSINADTLYSYAVTTSDPNGDTVTVTATTIPTWLSFSGSVLTGTPTPADVGTHIVTLTANDGNGGTTIQTFTITVTNDTDFADGLHDFILVNPPSTRNINGNLAVAGNTVMCLTDRTTTYGGTCDDSDAFKTSNGYISKFIDIDNDARTWNSTSSSINFPTIYDSTNNNGILWAGLFWQGRFSTDNDYPMRYGVENGSSYNLVEMGQGATSYNEGDSINVESLNAHMIKLKVDNGVYNDTQAETVYTYSTSNGTTYAAYSDVTAIIKDANISIGDHNFTVANLTTNEGREGSPGVFGGWSLLVIYKEDQNGHPRNISAYHGFQSLGAEPTIRISGFKLPSAGAVSSQAVVFSGEGEHLYGKNTSSATQYDWMKISNIDVPANYVYLPGPTFGTHIGNRDNMFNGQLTGISRPDIVGESNNLQINNDGIDIDRFDVSAIMETYRDINPDINEVFLKGDSNNDYVTPSMIAFSTELYVPKVCFDYSVQINAFDITDDNRSINAPYPGDLSLTIALQNEEGDFDFTNSQIGVRLVPDTNVTTFSEAFYAPNNVNTFIPALYMADSTATRPLIGVGEDVTLLGGLIRRNQRYFVAFDYLLTDPYIGKFEVDLNTTIDFGSGAVPIFQSTENSDIPRCPQSDVYNPLEGSFNVERVGATGAANQKFPLYTQIVGKDFDFELVAYNQSAVPAYSTELSLNDYTVDLELINASPFNDDRSIFTCNNPNPNIIQNIDSTRNHLFVQFPKSPASPTSRVDLSTETILTDSALRNAAFRVWYIIDKNNTILKHDCVSPDDDLAISNTCFQTLYDTYLAANDNITLPDGTASSLCGTSSAAGSCTNYTNTKMGTSGCYACLHDFFSRSVCSRDNFSIRPVSYRLQIEDGDQSTTPAVTDINLGQNDSTTVDPAITPLLAAGYAYKLTGMATSYLGDTVPALAYTKILSPNTESTLVFDTSNNPAGGCVDTNNTPWSVEFNNGQINKPDSTNTLVVHNNVGNYKYNIEDTNWTLVDQSAYPFKTFPGVDDCIPNDNTISGTSTGQSGCITDTNIVTNGFTYTDLQLIYRPYRFDISSVSLGALPQTGSNFLYMNDFSNQYYDDPILNPITMSAAFIGNVIARGRDGSITTNFQDGCTSNNVNISLGRTMVPVEATIQDSDNNNVPFEQYLQESNSSIVAVRDVNKVSTIDGNTSLIATAFTEPGTAAIRLHTNLRKPLNATVNPVDINYTDLNVSSPNAWSSAHMGTHIPDGNVTYNSTYRFYFTKVTPRKQYYDNITESSKNTPISVDIYCFDSINPTSTMCADFGLGTPSRGEDNTVGWHSATMFDGNNGDGIVDGITTLSANKVFGEDAGATVVMDTPHFNDINGTQEDVNVSLSGSARPTTIDVRITPDPWLVYDPIDINGYPHFRLRFIGESAWIGVGNRGKVGEATSNPDATRRMNW